MSTRPVHDPWPPFKSSAPQEIRYSRRPGKPPLQGQVQAGGLEDHWVHFPEGDLLREDQGPSQNPTLQELAVHGGRDGENQQRSQTQYTDLVWVPWCLQEGCHAVLDVFAELRSLISVSPGVFLNQRSPQVIKMEKRWRRGCWGKLWWELLNLLWAFNIWSDFT